jgi:class 3 adenylate cyclase
MSQLPIGTVTMLFADIEGSTPLVRELEDRYSAVLDDYRRLLRTAFSNAGGFEVDCRADELFAAFQRAQDGVTAAVSAQRMLAAHAWPDGARVLARIGLHTGEPVVGEGVYLGIDVHRAVRICAAGHGGQILLSQVTHDLVESRVETRDLGSYSLAGLARPERIYQLVGPQLRDGFPPLRVASTARTRFRRMPSRVRRQEQTLAEAAWQARRMLPGTSSALQQPMAELGAALFTGDRAVRGVDEFLGRVDDKGIARRLAGHRGAITPRARKRAEALEVQIECLNHLRERRNALAGLAIDLPGKLDELTSEDEIDSLRERVVAVIEEVDEALGQAARTLDALSYRLKRTHHRGIYRSGRRYAVPLVDEAGIERLREFDTLPQARDFRAALRVAVKGQREYRGASIVAGGQRGGRDAMDFTRGDEDRSRH